MMDDDDELAVESAVSDACYDGDFPWLVFAIAMVVIFGAFTIAVYLTVYPS